MTTQKILIADDEPTVHESLGIYLKADGFETVDAYDGQETLDKLNAEDQGGPETHFRTAEVRFGRSDA